MQALKLWTMTMGLKDSHYLPIADVFRLLGHQHLLQVLLCHFQWHLGRFYV